MLEEVQAGCEENFLSQSGDALAQIAHGSLSLEVFLNRGNMALRDTGPSRIEMAMLNQIYA